MYEYLYFKDNNYLAHHGVKGQKWGVRRYQNKDGSLIKRKGDTNSRILPAGTVMYRGVGNGSKNFMSRDYTYVSVTDDYSKHLYETNDGFEGRYDTDFKIQSTRPLKIASTSEYFNAVMKANRINPKQYLRQVPKDVVDKGKYAVVELLDHKLVEGDGGNYVALNKAVEYLSKKGYDGVVDPIDGAVQERDNGNAMATIVFNPSRNLKIVGEKHDRY